jgi:alanyl-tRNA synthetase
VQTSDIRRRFLEHFERNGHTVVPSAPLPFEDPNLLFVNAGMVQFVPYFIGQLTPPWRRATSVQKCIRTLDIDEVGKTTRHGTFFQMNGNFSFGDYFKEEAIRLAWDLSTKPVDEGGYGLDGDRIWATVFHNDDEAIEIWHRTVGMPLDRIVRRGMADNFWSMGIPGPCGPCSELYYDRGPDYGSEGGPDVDEDRYMEFWNLVFMQNERGPGTSKDDYPILGELPAKNIDTGMGLERMATLMQGVDNLYEIDETRPILQMAADLAGVQYGAKSGHAASQSHPDDVRLRVVADHVRSALMLIGDGVTPSNEGRGYVLRRIVRRAVRAMRLLGYDDRALPQLLPVARDCMAPSYPELATDFDRIAMIAYGEEEAFRRTLVAGTAILDVAVQEAKAEGRTTLSGARAFSLHDTYGFPIDLTLEMAAEQGLAVDQDGFHTLMTEQRQRAKADSKANQHGHANSAAYKALREKGPTEFTGYDELTTESPVRGLVRYDQLVDVAHEGDVVDIVLDRTPFYAESGGQVADAGIITVGSAELKITDVQRPIKGLIVHRAEVVSGDLRTGELALAEVDPTWRTEARQAHSGTHIVHAALRQVLGPSALQSGSYNRPGYLRLDFAWGSGLDQAKRDEIERVSNLALRADLGVRVLYMTLPEAREFGALALFGETYDEQVRVVEIGGPWSRELCGGTHVEHSSQVGVLNVIGESSVGAGVRRIEAYVGIAAVERFATERALVAALSDSLKTPTDQLTDRVEQLVGRLRSTEKELEAIRAGQVLASAAPLAEGAELLGGVRVVAGQAAAGVAGNDLRALALDVRGRLGASEPVVVVLASPTDAGAASFVVATNDPARQRGLSAGDLVKTFAGALGARGGGKPDLAQGAGGEVAKLVDAFVAVKAQLAASAG